MIKNLYNHRELLGELVKRDIKIKYRRSILGVVWSVLNPLLFMMIVTAVFANVFENNVKNFPIYFLCGQLLFAFFSESTSLAQHSIIGNAPLIKKVQIPRYIFPISKVCSALINVLLSVIAVIIMMLILGYIPPTTSILFFIPITYMYIFSVGISMLLASISVIFRDTIHLYSVLISAISYFSAIFYPIEIVPQEYRVLIEFNPIFVFINYLRMLVLEGCIPSIEYNVLCLSYCFGAILLGYFTFRKLENKFILYI